MFSKKIQVYSTVISFVIGLMASGASAAPLPATSAACFKLHKKSDQDLRPNESALHNLNIVKNVREDIQQLTKLKCDLDYKDPDNDGLTLLMKAASASRSDLVKDLIAAHADVQSVNAASETALMMAANFPYPKSTEADKAAAETLKIIKYLIAAHADLNARNSDGRTALSIAILISNYEDIVKTLIASHADVNAKDNKGWSLVYGAVVDNRPEYLAELIKAGADVNAPDNEGSTPLMSAAESGNVLMVDALIHSHADVNATTPGQTTALMLAAREGKSDVVNRLIAAHADVNAKNKRGYTALLLGENPEVVASLQSAGAKQ